MNVACSCEGLAALADVTLSAAKPLPPPYANARLAYGTEAACGVAGDAYAARGAPRQLKEEARRHEEGRRGGTIAPCAGRCAAAKRAPPAPTPMWSTPIQPGTGTMCSSR